jgi:hypothetical protein
VGTLINEPVKRAQGVATNLTALKELAAAWLPKIPMSGPSTAAEVTTAWLTAELAGHMPGAVAQRATALDGTTGTTDRRRLAVEWN